MPAPGPRHDDVAHGWVAWAWVPSSTGGRSASFAGSAPCRFKTRTERRIARQSTVHEIGSALSRAPPLFDGCAFDEDMPRRDAAPCC
jgi:hypothetical protein